MRRPSRTTREGVQPSSRTKTSSLLRDRSSSLAWIAWRIAHCTTQLEVCDTAYFVYQETSRDDLGGNNPPLLVGPSIELLDGAFAPGFWISMCSMRPFLME